MSKDFVVPISRNIDSVPIINDVSSAVLSPMDSLKEIASLADQGLVETAKELANQLKPRATLPDAGLDRAIRNPVIAASCLFVLFNSSSGRSLSARLNTVRSMLALMKGESNFNSALNKTLTSTYQGRKVVSHVKGALSFTTGTFFDASKRGASIISANRILRPSFDATLYMLRRAGWNYKYGSPSIDLDPNQILANVGQMARLSATIDRDWVWDASKGWVTRKSFGKESSAVKLQSASPLALRDPVLGRQVLYTYYHIHGLGAPLTRELHYVERLDQDVAFFKYLSGIPVFKDYIVSALPVSQVLADIGVGDVDIPVPTSEGNLGAMVVQDAVTGMVKAGYTPAQINDAIKDLVDKTTYSQLKKNQLMSQFVGDPWGYNRFLAKVYSIPYVYQPLKTAVLSAGYDDPRGYGKHKAYDYLAAIGQPVFAMDSGPVRRHASSGDSGNYMSQMGAVTGGDIKYMHLSKFIAANGEYVNKGDIIALAGNTGHSTGPHLHLQISDPKTGEKYPWPTKISDPRESINKRGQ